MTSDRILPFGQKLNNSPQRKNSQQPKYSYPRSSKIKNPSKNIAMGIANAVDRKLLRILYV